MTHRSGSAVTSAPRWWRDASIIIMWALGLVVLALWISNGGLTHNVSVADWLDSTGRITGLIASYLLLLQVFLMARVPFVERAFGQDKLTQVHRWVGFSSFNLMVLHILLITLGYASGSPEGIWGTLVDFTLNYPGMLLAVAGTVALCMVVFTSFKAARRRLRYESWHLIHLYAYLGAGLALPHQLWTGTDFLFSPLSTVFWWGLYILALAAVVIFRGALPLIRSRRWPLRVKEVRQENNSTVSVTVTGPGVRHLKAQGGQFFSWRFMDGPGWSSANPYSLSAAPTPNELRFTAGTVGDGSLRLKHLKAGTRVHVEGPFGRMHAGAATRSKALLIGAGMGITPMRALLESLPGGPEDLMIIHRYSTPNDLILHREIKQLAQQRRAPYFMVEGSRIPHRRSWLPQALANYTDADALLAYCPDLAERDVYICGPDAWMQAVARAARQAGIPRNQLHIEHFSN